MKEKKFLNNKKIEKKRFKIKNIIIYKYDFSNSLFHM
jgi:hypothetical protein